jgi:hypothetical protein
MRGFEISTRFGPPPQHPQGEPAEEHEAEMEQACK